MQPVPPPRMNVVPPMNLLGGRRDFGDDFDDDFDDDEFDDDDFSDDCMNATAEMKTREENMDHVRYQQLFKAVQEKDWEGVEDFISKNPEALTAMINIYKEETILHIITRSTNAPIWLVEKLASMVGSKSLEQLTDWSGRSALFCAAANGNTKVVEAFVGCSKDLPNIRDSKGLLPIHEAAKYGHKETIQYLLPVTRVRLDDENGVILVENLINSGLYATAFDLLSVYPKLAREANKDRRRILLFLANKPQAFESGSRLGYWKRLIYHWIPLQEEYITYHVSVDGDMENPVQRSNKSTQLTHLGFLRQISTPFAAMCQKFHIILWNALIQLAPSIKCIRDLKLMHLQTLQIVRMICHEGVIWSHKEALESLSMPLFTAIRSGICELVNEILKAYFYSYTFMEMNRHSIFHLAIQHRQEKVFSLIMNNHNLVFQDWNLDNMTAIPNMPAIRNMPAMPNMPAKTENILHLAARSMPSSHMSPMPLMQDFGCIQASGAAAALKMQKDLQWFKVVESYAQPSLQEQRNFSNKTPREMFTENHKSVFKKAEKWIKSTASWCLAVAAFIITVVLVATFIVPGRGIYTERIPVSVREVPLNVFPIPNAFALFTSTTSLLMFLGILTVRHSQEDYLESLPKKLIIGLITLFISIASMMLAVGGTVHKFLNHPWKWAVILISLLSCLAVALFALRRFPLLVEIFLSTYGPSSFRPTKKGRKNV